MIHRNTLAARCALLTLLAPAAAQAITFELPVFGDETIDAVLNTSITIGAGIRMQDRSADLVGKSNLDPDVCSGAFQSCQGVHRAQSYPAQHLFEAPGMASMNFDDGNLNYDKGDVFTAPFKLITDPIIANNNDAFLVNRDFQRFFDELRRQLGCVEYYMLDVPHSGFLMLDALGKRQCLLIYTEEALKDHHQVLRELEAPR